MPYFINCHASYYNLLKYIIIVAVHIKVYSFGAAHFEVQSSECALRYANGVQHERELRVQAVEAEPGEETARRTDHRGQEMWDEGLAGVSEVSFLGHRAPAKVSIGKNSH